MMAARNVGIPADGDDNGDQALAVPLRVKGMAPGQTVRGYFSSYYINEEKHTMFLEYMADCPITSIRFANSVLSNWISPGAYNYYEIDLGESILKGECDNRNAICVSITLPNPYEDICSQYFCVQDTMTISLANGRDYNFPVLIEFGRGVSKAVFLKVTDENGTDVPDFRSDSICADYAIPFGGAMRFTIEVLDAAAISTPPYHIQISPGNSVFEISKVTMVANGTKGQFTVTNRGNPFIGHYFEDVEVMIDLWDDSVDETRDTTTSYRFYVQSK